MREIDTSLIRDTVCGLFIKANYELPDDIFCAVQKATETETGKLAKFSLDRIVENVGASADINVPLCQDTGMAVVFAEVGQDIRIVGGAFEDAVNAGVRDAYEKGYLRKSIVRDPIRRGNTGDNTPAVIHTRIVSGDTLTLTAAPKGFGSENMSALKMFTPSASRDDIIGFVTDSVIRAGSNPCPPIIVGVGIGGNFEYCAYLAKKALLRPVGTAHPDPFYAELEHDMLIAVNATGIGAQGFGGDTTALGLAIETYPTHIAGLPVAVNISCHVTRHSSAVI